MSKLLFLMMMALSGQVALAQVPKPLIGKTFYNVNKWNMNPRFGGIPTIKFTGTNTANVKKGDIMETAKVRLYKKGFITTTDQRKLSDTFQFEVMPSKTFNAAGYEMKDQYGQTWSTRYSAAAEETSVKAYPEAKAGYVKNVIVLPKRTNEEQYKVELYAGVIQEVDCNSYSMMGVIEEKVLDGYGYTYYNVMTEEKLMGTMRGCLDGVKTTKFISTQPIIIRYNSNIPIVIYTPENVQVRYKVYATDNKWEFARQQ